MIKFWQIGILFLVVFFVMGWYFFGFNKLVYKKATVLINNQEFKVDLSDDSIKRTKGLSGRESLKENEGMLFLFDSAGNYGFWMKDMKFPIDIIWINNDEIVDLSPNLNPEPDKSIFNLKVYYPQKPVDKVLEINSGLIEKYNIKIGDKIKIIF
ncbi:MAG: DUF192 domain-containing protein [Minisyncoccia bacterium]